MRPTSAPGETTEPPQASADTHTRDRWRWLDQVLADPKVTPFAFQVAYVIASHVSRETGDAWPGQARIAEKAKGTERGVRNALDCLQVRGHLRIDKRQGRKETNRYRMAFDYRNGGSGNGGPEVPNEPQNPRDDRNRGSGIRQVDRNGGSGNEHEYRNGGSVLTGTAVPIIPMREPFERDVSLSAARSRRQRPRTPKPATSDAEFDEFWSQVPKKADKIDARRAYDKAILSGATTHIEIMAGIARYSADRTGHDPRYTKHPATWLNKGCWSDVPQTGSNITHLSNGRSRSGVASAMAGIDAHPGRRQENY